MGKQVQELTSELLATYKKLRLIRSEFLSKKYRPVNRSYPKYKLFDFEHPYREMNEHTQDAISSFEQMVKSMLDITIDDSSIRNELDKMTTMLILKQETDGVVERLRKL